MKFSAIIPTYKREKDLEVCISSIERQTLLPNEVLIIDDDNLSASYIQNIKNTLETKGVEFNYYKKNHEIDRRGLSESKNKAIEIAKHEIIFYLDDDLILENDFFEKIMDVWGGNKDNKLIGVGGKIINNRKKSYFEKIYNYVFFLQSKYKWDINDVGFQVWDEAVTENIKGYYTHGGVSSFRKDILRDLEFTIFSGGRTGLEDVDLCLRAKNKGYHLIYVPGARVVHNHSMTGKEDMFLMGYKEGRNRKIIFRNNSKKSLKNYLWFFWANVGWILRQFLARNFKKGLGMISGSFSKIKDGGITKSKLSNKSLGFFMTAGVSLAEWDKVGMLSREIEPYNILAEYFKKIYIFTYGDETDLKYKKYFKDNVEIVYKKSKINNHVYSWLLPFYNWRIIKNLDILKTNQMFGAQAALVGKILNRKVKLVVRTGYSLSFTAKQKNKTIFYWLISVFEYAVYKFSDFSLVTSRKVYDIITKRYGVEESQVAVVANYINTEIFKPNSPMEKYSNRLLYVGRVVKEKNLLSLVGAMQDMNLELDIVGGGNDPHKEVVIKKAKECNIKINFLGNFPNSELPKILNRYSIYIQPSFYEGMPKTILEAMSCGLACIGTNVEGIKEVIRDNKNGLIVETDIDSIKGGIIKLLDNKEVQTNLGSSAREYILENFSLATQIKKEIEIYEKIA